MAKKDDNFIRETRGGRPQYNDYRKFRKAVDDYFAYCAELDEFPDEKGMYIYIDFFEDDIAKLLDGNPKADEYLRILKLAQYRRESWAVRHMAKGDKASYGYMNILKQEQNGGYTDRPVVDKKQRIEIVLPDGATMDMFK